MHNHDVETIALTFVVLAILSAAASLAQAQTQAKPNPYPTMARSVHT